jgi:outer membrane biosynthesis protein TonB
MVGNTAVTYVRLAATALIAGLAAIFPYYPSWYWITAVIAAASAVGIHAIPAVGQNSGGMQMSEPTGRQLMGLDAREQTVTEPAEPEQAEEAAEPEQTEEAAEPEQAEEAAEPEQTEETEGDERDRELSTAETEPNGRQLMGLDPR